MSDARPEERSEVGGVRPDVRVLLGGLFDYAGLFPPAGLGMAETVRNFVAYRNGPHAWMLGRLIVPWSRRDEFLAALPDDMPACPVSLLIPLPRRGESIARLRAEHGAFASASSGRVHVGAVETKVSGAAGVAALGPGVDVLGELFPDAEIHAELLADSAAGPGGSADVETLLDALVEQRARTGRGAGKLRAGSVVPDEIPPTDDVVRFIRGCADRDLPWKATAGLHHPLPATRPLTYEADGPRGPMLGYLGVVLAAARVLEDPGVPDAALRALLVDPAMPDLDAVPEAALRAARSRGCLSIGSCSFVEPIQGAQSLALLPNQTETPR